MKGFTIIQKKHPVRICGWRLDKKGRIKTGPSRYSPFKGERQMAKRVRKAKPGKSSATVLKKKERKKKKKKQWSQKSWFQNYKNCPRRLRQLHDSRKKFKEAKNHVNMKTWWHTTKRTQIEKWYIAQSKL